MIRTSFLARLLMILAIIALAIAPVPITARGGMPVDAVGVMAGMDCCPPGDPVMPDCQKSCPYLALCMAKCFPAAAPSHARIAFIDAVKSARRFAPDETAFGWSIRPPAPPPRIQDIAGA
jgi:hypothetical protein